MLRKSALLVFMVVLTGVGFAQEAPKFGQRSTKIQDVRDANGKVPGNKELITKAKSFYVYSDTFFMKREQLQSSLLGRAAPFLTRLPPSGVAAHKLKSIATIFGGCNASFGDQIRKVVILNGTP